MTALPKSFWIRISFFSFYFALGPLLIYAAQHPSERPSSATNRSSNPIKKPAPANSLAPGLKLIDGAGELQKIAPLIRTLFLMENFEALENAANASRTNGIRFTNGNWKLSAFYAAFNPPSKGLSEAEIARWIALCEEWAKQYPDSPTPHIALAQIYKSYAWYARGSATADKVTPEGWKGMHERLDKAFASLARAKKFPIECPGWYSAFLDACLAADISREQFERHFEEAVRKFPDYWEIYSIKANHLLPRWHGQPGEWEEFAMQTMDRQDIPNSKGVFARIAVLMGPRFYEEFSRSKPAWARLKESFKDLQRDHPDSLRITSQFCRMSALLKDYEEAHEQFRRLDGRIDSSVWSSPAEFSQELSRAMQNTPKP